MKLTFFSLLIVFTISCKDNKTEKDNTTEIKEKYVAKAEATSVTWTAYKTTEKKPVGGKFATVKFNDKTGKTAEEALNGLEFSIPVNSLLTKDEGRDAKIKEFFFGAMLDTDLIKGVVKHNNGKYSALLTMNGETNELPLEVKITDSRRVKMNAVMQLKDWNALEALASLNKVCYDLHKGPDGVSKTWEEVAIEVETYLRK